MSKAMTEEEVRTKFGDLFEDAYETIANQDKHELIMTCLQSIAEDEADLKMFLKDLDGSECDHKQLYAHVTVDIVLPVAHNSASEMTRVLDHVYVVLGGTGLTNCRIRPEIEVGEDGTLPDYD